MKVIIHVLNCSLIYQLNLVKDGFVFFLGAIYIGKPIIESRTLHKIRKYVLGIVEFC